MKFYTFEHLTIQLTDEEAEIMVAYQKIINEEVTKEHKKKFHIPFMNLLKYEIESGLKSEIKYIKELYNITIEKGE